MIRFRLADDWKSFAEEVMPPGVSSFAVSGDEAVVLRRGSRPALHGGGTRRP